MNKIFYIGFQKTGTSSLHVALQRLGYRVCGIRSDFVKLIEANESLQKIWNIVEKFDAFEDHLWLNLFKELDDRYPMSKFVLTLRDSERWFASCKLFFTKPHFVQEWLYGNSIPPGDKDSWVNTQCH